ncbi:hypothetical protein KSF_109450 [Reticulibacter mediterranei]|uniref:FAD-binding domain-containing protein n=1 Tax=Reticulibacter mediterranei TaxID=2778369 RepID=A0A8J3N6Z2_9CHLR|nr:FAD-dependent oxidoreductase [Reticulibacter mediterranei]GHP00898.1 hypothetical protein KSF_109450 [Reticulibacter mediterranei]
MTTIRFQHAIVIGGGIAGLLAARALANSCEGITIIERDTYPDAPTFRAGTPQARHVHAFPLRGQQILEAFFPSFGESLLKAGARMHDYASQGLYFYGSRCPQIAPGLLGWSASRMLVEWQVRQEMQKFSHVQWVQQCNVRGLLYENHAVRGVKYQKQGTLENPIDILEGDLVIDASGSSSEAPIWLEKIGYQPPRETIVNPFIGYATRVYTCPEEEVYRTWWSGLAIQGTGQNRRAGALMEIEGGRWMVLLAGSGMDYPPNDPEAYLAFAQSLPEPALYESIKNATPLSPVYGYRPIGNRFRHYEQMDMPRGFIIVGDAACTFNPIYGQGITVAALEAQALERCLHTWHRKKDPFSHFQRHIARLLASPWMLAITADSTQEDRKTLREQLANWYLVGHVIPAIPKDPKVERIFLEILHMLKTPNALLHPAMFVRVLIQSRKKN